MSADPAAIPAQIDKLHRVYDEIQQLNARMAELGTVECARAEYDRLLADWITPRDALRKRKDELDAACRLQRSWGVEVIDPPRKDHDPGPSPPRPPGWLAPRPVPLPPLRPPDRQARRRLKNLVNRWKRALEPEVLGQVNQINDDPSRPLGEALMLLPATVLLRNPNHDGESESDQLTRLSDWVAALVDYREARQKELDALEMGNRGLLGIWRLWSARDRDPAGRQRWETFLAETCRALAQEIAALEQEVNDLAAQLGTAGGPP
jgi:hypothetical protein